MRNCIYGVRDNPPPRRTRTTHKFFRRTPARRTRCLSPQGLARPLANRGLRPGPHTIPPLGSAPPHSPGRCRGWRRRGDWARRPRGTQNTPGGRGPARPAACCACGGAPCPAKAAATPPAGALGKPVCAPAKLLRPGQRGVGGEAPSTQGVRHPHMNGVSDNPIRIALPRGMQLGGSAIRADDRSFPKHNDFIGVANRTTHGQIHLRRRRLEYTTATPNQLDGRLVEEASVLMVAAVLPYIGCHRSGGIAQEDGVAGRQALSI